MVYYCPKHTRNIMGNFVDLIILALFILKVQEEQLFYFGYLIYKHKKGGAFSTKVLLQPQLPSTLPYCMSPEGPTCRCCTYSVPTSSSTFTSLPAVCSLVLTLTTLTSHSGYHTQQCLTKTLGWTSQPQLQMTEVRSGEEAGRM